MIDNKTIIITGFYSGIGFQTALELAEKGSHIIGIGRSEDKAKKAIEEIKEKTGNDKINFVGCDLAEIDQVKKTAEKIKSEYAKIDILINNAGIINTKLKITSDGYENTFAVSAIASFLFTRILLDKLLQSENPKVINLTSEGYKQGTLDFDLFRGKGKYKTMSSYSNAKMAEMLWTYEMADRLQNLNITFRLVHPGLVPYTGGVKKMPWGIKLLIPLLRLMPISNTLKEGARPVIEAAQNEEAPTEKILYLKEGKPEEPVEAIKDKQNRKAIWEFLNDITRMPVKMNI